MQVHLLDATYELFRAHFAPRPQRVDAAGRPASATIGLIESTLYLLRDEGDTYAENLRQAGVTVRHEVFPGVDHYFTHTGPKEPADAAWALMEQSLVEAFRRD